MCKKVKMSCIVMCVGLDLHTDSDSPHLALEWVFFSGSIHLSALVSKTSPLSVKAAHRRDPGTEFYSTRPGEWHQTLTHTHTYKDSVTHTTNTTVEDDKDHQGIICSKRPPLSSYPPLTHSLCSEAANRASNTESAPEEKSD